MLRTRLAVSLLALTFAVGCAGPAKLTQKSGEKLAEGDAWRAWALAVKALDKAPGHPEARDAATAAAGAIADDWRRRIRALAASDTILAAEQVLEFEAFREGAARYATVPSAPGWPAEERALRAAAASIHYRRGQRDLATERPKRAYGHLIQVARFEPEYRDAAQLADRALERGTTRVAFVPFRSTGGEKSLGREVAAEWRGEAAERLAPPETRFTRVLPTEDLERKLSVSALERMSRDDALRLGRRANAERVVWGTVGGVDSKTSVHVFSETVARRVVQKDAEGNRVTRWVDVPLHVVARVRTVTVDLDYEVIATAGGTTLARGDGPVRMSARALWTAFLPDADGNAYALVSDEARAADPVRAKRIEASWQEVAGEGTSLSQVIEARRSSRSAAVDRDGALASFRAGAAFVLLEELPSARDLARVAVARHWQPVLHDLHRLDAVDDVDLGLTASE